MRNLPVVLTITGTLSLKEIERQWLDCCGRSQLPKVGVYDSYTVENLVDLGPSFMEYKDCYIVSLTYLWGHSYWVVFSCKTGKGNIILYKRIKEGVSIRTRVSPQKLHDWLTTKQNIQLRPCDANLLRGRLEKQVYDLFEDWDTLSLS